MADRILCKTFRKSTFWSATIHPCDYVSELLKPERYRQGRLLAALATLIAARYKLRVAEADWDRQRIDPHLLMRIAVVDEQGKVLAAGRDLRALKQRLAQQGQEEARTWLRHFNTIAQNLTVRV